MDTISEAAVPLSNWPSEADVVEGALETCLLIVLISS